MKNELNENIPVLIDGAPEAIINGVASRVRARRLELNLTQKALATRAGMPVSTYRRFETMGQIAFHSLVSLGLALNLTEEFSRLFASRADQNTGGVLASSKLKERKRGRRNG